jgi:hypothetical protein
MLLYIILDDSRFFDRPSAITDERPQVLKGGPELQQRPLQQALDQ